MSDNTLTKKDPNGMMSRDIVTLRQVFKVKKTTPKSTMAEIQHNAGQQSVIDWIELQVNQGGISAINS